MFVCLGLIMYCNVLYSNVLYCTVLYRTNVILFAIRSTCSPHLKITDLFIIVQYSTVHYSTVQYSTVQYFAPRFSAQNRGGQAQNYGGQAQIAGGQHKLPGDGTIAGGQPQIDDKDDHKNIIDVLAPHNIYDHIWLKYLLKPYLA